MNGIDLHEVAKKYNSIAEIWAKKDRWHLKTKEMIQKFIISSLEIIPAYQNFKILNLGSAGHSYGLDENNIIHIDIAYKKISHLKNACVADIQNAPIITNQFDLIICVGSVINYCDPIVIIQEFHRLLKDGGHIILEFENSLTFELLGKTDFNKSAAFIETFYNGQREKIWYFSETFINQVAIESSLIMIKNTRCHILSPLIYRVLKKESFAAWFSNLDKICLRIPLIKKFGSNVIYLYKKKVVS